jgi:hypothetical protein
MQTLKLKCIYKGGPADERRLDLYDGAVSLEGLSRAIAITTHAFINGEIRTHGEAARGAKFYLLPARPGSFVIDIAIWMAGAYASGLFYDFVRHTFREVVGTAQDDADLQNGLLRRIEPTIGELPAVLEGPLRQIHRPIREHPHMTLTIASRGARRS